MSGCCGVCGEEGVFGLVWFGLGLGLVWFWVWFGLDWCGLVWFGLVLVWFGLVWLGLGRFGLVWFCLVWFGFGLLCFFNSKCNFVLILERLPVLNGGVAVSGGGQEQGRRAGDDRRPRSVRSLVRADEGMCDGRHHRQTKRKKNLKKINKQTIKVLTCHNAVNG